MGKAKKPKSKGALTSDLLQRIDNMEENKDYNPYQAVKRTTIKDEELFNEEDYSVKEDEDTHLLDADRVRKDKVKVTLVCLVVGALGLAILGGLVYLIYIGGLSV